MTGSDAFPEPTFDFSESISPPAPPLGLGQGAGSGQGGQWGSREATSRSRRGGARGETARFKSIPETEVGAEAEQCQQVQTAPAAP